MAATSYISSSRLSLSQCFTAAILWLMFLTWGQCSAMTCIEVKKSYAAKGFDDADVLLYAKDESPGICPQGQTCCPPPMEPKLVTLSRKEHAKQMEDAFKILKTVFASRTKKFDQFFSELLDNARRDLHEMFVKTYGLLYQKNSAIFADLFDDLRAYYTGKDRNLEDVMDGFFSRLLQKMFELLNGQYVFDDDYLSCVTERMNDLRPFGDVPGKLSVQVKRAFIAARTFVQGLAMGRDVILNILEIAPTESCVKALVKMTHCPQCRGLTNTRPCNNYCLNAMKGCLAQHAELNAVWNQYIDALKNLARRLEGPFNIESVVDPIDVKISDAIMNMQENSEQVSSKIFAGCGQPRISRTKRQAPSAPRSGGIPSGYGSPSSSGGYGAGGSSSSSSYGGSIPNLGAGGINYGGGSSSSSSYGGSIPNLGAGGINYGGGSSGGGSGGTSFYNIGFSPKNRARPTTAAGTSLDRLVRDINEKIKPAKDFWVQLPYNLCNDEDFAAPPSSDEDCWNGNDRARYMPEVQKDGVMNQINNPEVYVDVSKANSVITQQMMQLKTITSRLQGAYNGEDVDWIDELTIDGVSGSGSGDDIGGGSGSGSGGLVTEDGEGGFVDIDNVPPFKTVTSKPSGGGGGRSSHGGKGSEGRQPGGGSGSYDTPSGGGSGSGGGGRESGRDGAGGSGSVVHTPSSWIVSVVCCAVMVVGGVIRRGGHF